MFLRPHFLGIKYDNSRSVFDYNDIEYYDSYVFNINIMTHQLRKKLTNNIPKVVSSTLQNKPSGIH